jgi:hypothetical protein
VLDRAAHGISDDQPELFRALVADWLDRVEAETLRTNLPATATNKNP